MKSIMSAIPNYVMQGEALPIHLCEKLDKNNRIFYGGQLERRKNFIWLGGVK